MTTPAEAYIRYMNQGATRNQPLNPDLVNAMSFLNELGVTMDVFSGGQDATGPHRTGSHRHDHGNAGDVFFSKGGRQLDWANPDDVPVFQDIVRRGKAAGVTGFGAGEGYMRPGSMHLGFGTPAVWGADGSGANAPDWLRNAYGSGAGADRGRGQSHQNPMTPEAAPPAAPATAAPEGPEQSPLGKMMAGFASGFGGMGGGGGAADGGAPAVIQDGGFGATMAAQQGAEQAKQLAFTMSPDIEKLLALAPKPFAKKPVGPVVVG